MDLFNMSLENVQATVLVGNLSGVEGEPELESLFFAIAFRVAQIVRLPTPDPNDGAVSREVKLRTWWTLYVIDRWSSAELAMPQQMPDDDHHFHHLPMSEVKFWHLKPDDPESEESYLGGSHGLWGYMVLLARIFDHIQNLLKNLADRALNDMEAEQRTWYLAHELERFIDLLPLDAHFSVEKPQEPCNSRPRTCFCRSSLGLPPLRNSIVFSVSRSPTKRDAESSNVFKSLQTSCRTV